MNFRHHIQITGLTGRGPATCSTTCRIIVVRSHPLSNAKEGRTCCRLWRSGNAPYAAFFDPRFNPGAQSSGSQPQQTVPTVCNYEPKTDPWSNYGNDFAEGNESTMTTEPGIDSASAPEQAIVIDHIVPPMAFP